MLYGTTAYLVFNNASLPGAKTRLEVYLLKYTGKGVSLEPEEGLFATNIS